MKQILSLSWFAKGYVLWCAFWFALEIFLAITLHSVFALLFVVFFGVFLVKAINHARWELGHNRRMAEMEAEHRAVIARIFGNNDSE